MAPVRDPSRPSQRKNLIGFINHFMSQFTDCVLMGIQNMLSGICGYTTKYVLL
jgi:hypothetical protein